MFSNLIIIIISLLNYSFQFNHLTKYSEDEARKLIYLCAASYGNQHVSCLNQTFKDVSKYQLYSSNKAVCDELGTICENYAVASDTHKRVYFVFRGSRGKVQVFLEGIDQWKSKPFLDIGQVNSYFKRAHTVLWPPVLEILNNSKFKNYKFYFTGHSLGGALASLAAVKSVRLGFLDGENVKLVTFGQPRVGNYDYARNFDNLVPNSFRVVHRRDIVPHLPSCLKSNSTINGEFAKPCNSSIYDQRYHHGTEIWYPNGMSREPIQDYKQYVECIGQPLNEDFNCSDALRFFYSKSSEYIWDHRHYFGIRVPEFGKTGCDRNNPEGN
ncbi:unnamed protein product [Caenorhabditis angaria]|uniref:Fungal lipase-type domain-containing protein n=1 Tax=Caenorhabditis angaria TaxID=860376 RepID=A0A9P1ISD2_9PELO|nr:unnamed protein product [Caenorhabditis angaria]